MTAVFQPMIDLLPSLGTVALLLVGAWRIETGAASAGQLVQAVALFGYLAFPMRIIGFMFEAMPRSVVSVRRVDGLPAEPTDPAAQGLGSRHDHSTPTELGSPPEARRTVAQQAADSDAQQQLGTATLPDGPIGLELDGVSFRYARQPAPASGRTRRGRHPPGWGAGRAG